MRTLRAGLWLGLLAFAPQACSKGERVDKPGNVDDEAKLRPERKDTSPPEVFVEPPKHRKDRTSCSAVGNMGPVKKFEPEPPPPVGPACKVDTDCVLPKKPTGFPGYVNVRCMSGHCLVNHCLGDTDCSGRVCHCDDAYGNRCLNGGNCQIDADCGVSGYCSPSMSSTCPNMGGTAGYFCRTKEDTCKHDSDCTERTPNGYCVYQPSAKKWGCSYGLCVGSLGPR